MQPSLLSGGEALSTGGGELVELGLAGVGGDAPFAQKEAVTLQAVEGGIERAFFDLQQSGGGLLDMERDAEAVIGTPRQSF